MSTRCNIHFCHRDGTIASNIYRHCDGYPDGVMPDLALFFADVRTQTTDTRFDDAEYLAAKFVVWQAGRSTSRFAARPLAFLSLGICLRDHGDIEYVYRIVESADRDTQPVVEWAEPGSDNWHTDMPEDDEEDED